MQLENLSLNMSSGNVQLSHLSTTHFEQEGSSGYVSIDSLTTKTGSLNMISGKMEVTEYSGNVDAALSSGRLTLEMKNVTDTVDLEVLSGFATLDLPSDADFTLNGEIGSGAITTDFNLTNSKEDEHKIEGVHGSGEHAIDLHVNSGKIEVK
jgi:lia operon protein LiaG